MKKTISIIAILIAIAALIISNYSLAQTSTKKTILKSLNSKSVVVLELFTSQGCSSCPSADVVLSKYAIAKNSNVIALAFHVDYWNRLGWKDPFSKAEYSERQREYAQNFNSSNVYTPQIVINGKYELVGSNENEIAEIVNKESKLTNEDQIKIESTVLKDNKLTVKINSSVINDNTIVNIALVKKKEFTNIKRGENSGLQQVSNNIVFDFKTILANNKNTIEQTFSFESNWKPADFSVVVYTQNKKTGTITSAVQSEIN